VSFSLPRVIFVNRVYWPSTEATAQLLTDLAEGLAARGWPVEVIAAGEGPAERNGVSIHRTGAGERHGGMISRAWNFLRFQAAARRRLRQVARPGDVVVAMTDPPLLGTQLAPGAAKLGLRLVLWIQDIYPEIAAVHFGPAAGFLLTPFRQRRDRAWRQARTCVALGDDMARTLGQHGVAPGAITLIPNWAPRELAQPAAPSAIAERRQDWKVTDKFVVAYSGNLGRVHEFDTVLQAAERLRDEPGIIFLLIGRGPRLEAVTAAAERRGLGNIRMLPPEPRERLGAALAAADAHLVTLRPAYADLVFPSKLAGVLAAGRPALFVGPAAGEISRLLIADACGATFAPGDAAGLADTILRWRADPVLTCRLGSAARDVYQRTFTLAAALDRWEQCLRRAATP
jgi:colanic acid biosynthesis glycosyl transferase WcaI